MDGVAIVLLDEVETLAVSRHRLSLEANPIDVHRATDAALAGMDRLTREHRNVLLIATTNFPEALDEAVLSRADHIEEIGLPTTPRRRDIIADTLESIGAVWKGARRLEARRRSPREGRGRASTAAASARQFSPRWPRTSRPPKTRTAHRSPRSKPPFARR